MKQHGKILLTVFCIELCFDYKYLPLPAGGTSLLCKNQDDESTNERFTAICRTSNGFEIAEADIKLREMT